MVANLTMQAGVLKPGIIKVIGVTFLFFCSGDMYSQNITPNDKTIIPPVITQSYLDSTRNISKGEGRLNAAYLGLVYNFRSIDSVEWIYNEIRVPKGEAALRTYYCVIQGYNYYCGIQTNSKPERRIIFSAWDSRGGKNKTDIPDSEKSVLVSAGKGVIFNRFNNEGSGIHTHYQFDWREDSTYKFLIHTVPDSILKTSTITLFVYIDNSWKLIAKIRRSEFIGYEKGAASFMEDFTSRDDKHRRSGSFQNFWVRNVSGSWKEINRVYYYLPFGDGNRKIKDFGCGLSTSHGFMLISGGGFAGAYIPTPVWLTRDASGIIPVSKLPE
jgi:hypothetical protein